MKQIAQNQMKLIKQSPAPKFYNFKSVLMIGAGALGMSLVLKYQDQFNYLLPDWMLIEQPYPDDKEKINFGKQSLYYYSQSLYFQALSGWTIIFLKRSRMISPLTYLMISMGFLVGTYLTDYYKHPNLKHSLWFLFNITFGAVLGSYFYQQNFKILIDALYLIGNSMTFYAASCYYNKEENQGIILTALCSSVFGIFYGLGVLRLFRWGMQINDWKLYAVVLSVLGIVMPWSIYRSIGVQDEYDASNFNPINASLSFQWKQIPQVSVFADVFYHNHRKNKQQIRGSQNSKFNEILSVGLNQQKLLESGQQIMQSQNLLLQIIRQQTQVAHKQDQMIQTE